MKLNPSPGIAIVEPLEEEQTLKLTNTNQGRITRGKIIEMGPADMTQNGTPIKPDAYGKKGDIVWFMHYYEEGGVDVMVVQGKKLFAVKWQDFRAVEHA